MTDVSCHHPCTWPDCTVTDQKPVDTIALITECRDALADELRRWNIGPPPHLVKQAHDKCVAWLAAPPAQPADEPCCGEFATCDRACTPRGEWIAHRANTVKAESQPAPAQEPAQRLSDERAAFEKWHKDYRPQELTRRDDTYYNAHARCRWEGWQAHAHEAAIVPPGYVVVPMEPTPEMVSAGWNYLPSAKGDWFIKNVWGAMIAAAQKATP